MYSMAASPSSISDAAALSDKGHGTLWRGMKGKAVAMGIHTHDAKTGLG